MRTLKVGVYEEQEIFRRGLVACLREDSDMDVCVGAPEYELLDLDVAVASPTGLSDAPAGCPVVVCTDNDAERARAVSQVGVFAVLPRRSLEPEQLDAAVRAAAAHLHVTEPVNNNGFDERSRAVVRMLAAGLGTREISRSLGYSERTIKGVLASVQRDLGTRTRAQTVAEAVRQLII